MPGWEDLLLEIKKIEERYGSSLRDSASGKEIIKLIDHAQKELGYIELSESYIDFLRKVNGLDFNGLVIYGVDQAFLDKEVNEDVHGFIETNQIWHENDGLKRYIFFGDSDTAWYGYDEQESVYVELDKPSGTLIQSFESFDSLIKDALETIIS